MVVGDGAIIRAGLDAILDLLGKFAAPTGARGSILLMAGGLIVLGFLFLAFLFRSAIVGDLAPVANARAPTPRALLPPRLVDTPPALALPPRPFETGRQRGREAKRGIDGAMDHIRVLGADARIIQSHAQWKRVRLYSCLSCKHGHGDCEYERGLLAGAFENVTGDVAKVHEIACAARGAPHCEFDVMHAHLVEAR